ncbi:MAG: glycosyltransferase family 1 protein [Acidobacteria bacterium]|nr:MAG: glycosyltransferase family 1 protein [Acidobacteriota bacterium]REK03148.1 MAG: glycosyltransferase family 1 protein [Acidobacteriota bacterium]REK15397.1 MAG: glycosyltransferase family 1 protein [Acidobacteriota bacterium]REK42116.1 MAG: glycosyltransferase family 1 protein [Acidobacteriota bacterium]
MTSKRLIRYARKNGFPFLCVHAGKKTEAITDGSVEYLSLKRSPVAFPMDEGLKYDPLFQRHTKRVLRKLVEFRPDVMHITGLNDVSIMGAYLAWKLNLPLIGSWHTNLHEFAARRLTRMFRILPGNSAEKLTDVTEDKILKGAMLYYKMPKVLMAPNKELVEILEKGTGRETKLMARGVDVEKFDPVKRTVSDGTFRIGFVGRLRAEKNVRLLKDLEDELVKAGAEGRFKFLIVGEGNERDWLSSKMKYAELTGFLDGEDLSEAYANMDLFVFPSETDAFGNVVQEATASGVPALVTDKGGPKFIVTEGRNGFICKSLDDFVRHTLALMNDRDQLLKMKEFARNHAQTRSWDSVFDTVYDSYRRCIYLKKNEKKLEAARQT